MFIRDAGLTHFAYRCDREASINSMIDEACSVLGRSCKRIINDEEHRAAGYPLPLVEENEPDAPTEVPRSELQSSADGPVIAVPELTHPGGSASNGLAERSVGVLEDFVRTHLLAVKTSLQCHIPIEHPIVDWVVQHAAYLLNKYQTGKDGKTAFSRLHGIDTRERLCKFGDESYGSPPRS